MYVDPRSSVQTHVVQGGTILFLLVILWVDWALLGGFPAAHGVFLDCSPLGWNVQDGRPHGEQWC